MKSIIVSSCSKHRKGYTLLSTYTADEVEEDEGEEDGNYTVSDGHSCLDDC